MDLSPRFPYITGVYKLLATDIDDTLTDHDGTLHPASQEALRALHRRGIEVVLSSGRATVSMAAVAERLFGVDAPRYLISFNGGQLVDRESGKELYSQGLHRETFIAMVEYGRENGLYFQGFDADQFVVESVTDYTDLYATGTGMSYRVAEDLAYDPLDGSPKLLFVDDHDRLVPHHSRLTEIADGRYRVTFSKPHLLEVVPPDVSKGAALEKLAELLGVPIAHVVAVGDAPNDIEMIKSAGVGVAVANAHPSLKECADWITSRSAGEGAVAEVVERYFPGREETK